VNRGVPTFAMTPGSAVAAPVSGVRLGTGAGGPLTLRLFRLRGTRVVITSAVLPAQLIALRAAAAGTPVQVVTNRPHVWEPLLAHDLRTHLITESEVQRQRGGAELLVDDQPVGSRGATELGPWQCRIDVRARWTPTEIGSFVHTDIAIFATAAAEHSVRIAAAFGLPRQATGELARLDERSFGIVRRGRIEYASVDPTRGEQDLLARAGGFGG
jgi:hypothetical protein